MDSASLSVLSRGLDQLDALLVHVRSGGLDRSSPCAGWTLGDLVDHVVTSPGRFSTMARGEQPDWSATPEHRDDGWAAAFRAQADELLELVRVAEGGMDPDWMTAEFAVHAWDLAH